MLSPCTFAALHYWLVTGLLLAAAPAAHAQEQPPAPPQPQQSEQPQKPETAGRARPVGPGADQGLHVDASLSVVYDDNVYRVDSRAEDPVDDLIVTPTVEVSYNRDVGPRSFRLRGLLGYDQFVSETARSKPRIELEGAGRFLIAGTCAVEPLASYREQRADYGDINSRAENLQRYSTLSVAADCERPGFYPVVAWRRDTTRNGDGFEYADQTSNLYRAGLGYSLPSLGKLTWYYEHFDSDRPELAVTNRGDAVGIAFDRAVSPLTTINADLRWMRVRSSAPAIADYNGPGWTLRVTNTAIPRVKLSASTERTIVNDSLIATGFAIRTAHRLSAEVGLSELTSITAYADFSRRQFRQDAAIRPFSYTRDRTNQFGLIAQRKFTDRLAADLSVSRIDRSTNSDVSNYRATRVALGVTMRF